MSLIALTCQNRRDITEHAGRCRNFLIYTVDGPLISEPRFLELPLEGSLHHLSGDGPHPLDGVDLLISASMGQGLRARLGQRGIRTVLTRERNPLVAVQRYLQGSLPDEAATESEQPHDGEHAHTGGGCGHCQCSHAKDHAH